MSEQTPGPDSPAEPGGPTVPEGPAVPEGPEPEAALTEIAAASPDSPEQPEGPPGEDGWAPGRARLILNAVMEGNSFIVTVLALVAALVVGGLINAFSNTTVLHAWGNLFSAPGHAIALAWDTAVGAYVELFEGSIFNPHTVSALFQQASISAAIHDGYLSAVFNPLSETCRAGHAADPGWARGRAAVPGGPVQHRRAEPVHRRRHRGHLPRLRRQPAARDPRDRLRARQLRRRGGDRLAGRRAQGPDRRARGDRHHHAQLHHGLLPGLPALLPLPDAGAGDGQPDHLGHRGRTRTCRCCSARTCASTPAS